MSATPAASFTRWWAGRVEAWSDQPSLGAALLSGRWLRYGWHRLRGFAVARSAGVALHVLEALILVRYARTGGAVRGFVIANLALVAAGAWWGATEVLRKRIRALDDDGTVDAETGAWLARSVQLACVVAATAIGLGVTRRADGLGAAFTCAVGIRLALDLPLRVWHARVMARNRLYRSPWAQVGTEAVGTLLVPLLFPVLGAGGALAAYVAGAVASRVVTLHYLRRAYVQNGFRWPRLRLRARRALPWLSLLGHAVAGAATRVPNALGVLLLVAARLPLNVAVGVQLAVGMLIASTGWPWTHYHDLLPVEGPALAPFRRRIARAVMLESVIIGALVGMVALALVVWLTPRQLPFVADPGVVIAIAPTWPAPTPYLELVPALALALSVLAAAHVLAWTRDRLGSIVVGAATTAVVATLAIRHLRQLAGVDDVEPGALRHAHLVMAAAMLAVALATWAWASRRQGRAPRGLVPWLTGVAAATADDRDVHIVGLARGGPIADEVGRRLGAAGARWWTRRERQLVTAGLSQAQLAQLVGACGGWVTSVRTWREDGASLAVTSAAPPRPGELRVRIIGGRVREPAPRDTLTAIWRALLAFVAGGRGHRDTAIVDATLVDGELATASVRLRGRASSSGARGPRPAAQ